MDNLIEAGKIINSHGVCGDIKLEVWLDSVDFLKKFKKVYIGKSWYEVKKISSQKNFAILHLDGIDNIDDVIALKGSIVYVDKHDVILPKGKFFISDIIGSEVFDENGNFIGILEDVIDNPAHLIYVIRGESEHLVPAVPEFIISVNTDDKTLKVRLIEGL